jgi:SAM-dependent methyltransferase
MPVDQSGKRDGVPERFAPKEMRGQLIEAEHVVRYRWAAAAAAGKRVLDAGCGTAYGTAMLADAGATEVVGVDLAESVLESVRAEMPDSVNLRSGDLRALELDDDSFDLVVCFEVIEHFEEPLTVLDQLARVLAPGGTLLISSPNRGVYPAGNPHHFHEFTPAELTTELSRRFANVRLMRQQSYVTSAVLSDELFGRRSDEPLADLPLYKLSADELDSELYTLAIASDGELEQLPSQSSMTDSLGLGEWVEASKTQERALQAHRQYIEELEAKVADRPHLQMRLIELEQQLATVPDLLLQLEELSRVKAELSQTAAELRSTKTSFSWRMTRPLRDAKGNVRRLLRSG